MSKTLNYNKIEKAFSKDVVISEDGGFEIRVSLENLCNRIIEKFSPEEIAYFMFMLGDDGGLMKVEEKYLELMENHYRKLSDEHSDEDYKKIAEKYKSVIEEYL